MPPLRFGIHIHHRSAPKPRILVAEDDVVQAFDVKRLLESAGAVVIGPAPSIAEGFALIRGDGKLDAAVLDVGLRDGRVNPLATVLRARDVPVVLVTGYLITRKDFPALLGCRVFQKPYCQSDLIGALVSFGLALMSPTSGATRRAAGTGGQRPSRRDEQ